MKFFGFAAVLILCISNITFGDALNRLDSEDFGLVNEDNGLWEIFEELKQLIKDFLDSDFFRKIVEFLGRFFDTIKADLRKVFAKWLPKIVEQFTKLPKVVARGNFWYAVRRLIEKLYYKIHDIPENLFWEIVQTLDHNKPVIEETFSLVTKLTGIYVENLKHALHDLIWGQAGKTNEEEVVKNLSLQKFLEICRMVPRIIHDEFWKVIQSHLWDIFNAARGFLKMGQDLALHMIDDSYGWLIETISRVLDESSLFSAVSSEKSSAMITQGKNGVATNGFKEIWSKVVAAVKSYTGPFKEDLEKLVLKYKPRIIKELQEFKKVSIKEGKDLVIEMLTDAIKIIIKGGFGYEA